MQNPVLLYHRLPERVKNEDVKQLKPKKLLMLIALDKCLGNVAEAAKAVNINRVTHYRWMNNNPVYKKAVEATMNVTQEWNEAKLLKFFEETELKNIMFLLSMRGRNRGYTQSFGKVPKCNTKL